MRLIAVLLIAALAAMPATTRSAVADEQAELERLLHSFLAAANDRRTHETFWADDLIYTSSAGARFGKQQILDDFDAMPTDAPPGPQYSAESVTVRVMGDLGVVTFKLLATSNGEREAAYFNTGVFRKDDGEWTAFTWQATRIPASK